MITYEDAFKKAKGLKPSIDRCTEYENGFMFWNSKDNESEGGTSPCVILKKSGEAISMSVFVLNGTGKEIKTIKLK